MKKVTQSLRILILITFIFTHNSCKKNNATPAASKFNMQLSTGNWVADKVTASENTTLNALVFTASKGSENIRFYISKAFEEGSSSKLYYAASGFSSSSDLLPGIFTDQTNIINGKTLAGWGKAGIQIIIYDKKNKVLKGSFLNGGFILFTDNSNATVQGGEMEIHY